MKHIITIALLALVLLASGCSQKAEITEQTAPAPEQGASENAILIADEKAENILTGLNSGDYAMFSADFSDRTKESMDKEYFDKLSRFLKENSGNYLAKTLAFSKGGTQFGYDCQFSKENVLLGITLSSDLTKVETLYLDSEKIRNRLASNLEFA